MTKEKIYAISDRSMPAALQSLLEYKQLTSEERFNFAARLKYVEEITKKIEEWRTGQEADLRAFVDRIELDLYINVGAPSSSEGMSSWLVHSSWTHGVSGLGMRQAISNQLVAEINRPQVPLDGSIGEWANWLKHQNAGLRTALTNFYEAAGLEKALANLLVVDILLASLLSGMCRLRASPSANL